MTLIPFPNDPARLAATNPIFNDNSFVRGDEQRLNNSEIWANFSELDSVLEIVQNTYLFRGLIQGGLNFDSLTTAPKVKQGLYEVNGRMVYKTSETTIALTDTLFNNLQAIETNVGYAVMMDENGSCKYCMFGEGIAQASQSVTNITGTTTKTLTVGTVPGSTTEVYVAYITGTGSFTGIFKATRASATTFTIVLDSDLGSTFSGMNVVIYYKFTTLHGTGTLTGISTTSEWASKNYSLSLGENGETNTFGLFDSTKNGFYCTLPGHTGYRIIGSISMSNNSPSTNEFSEIFSFRSGRNKNDNLLTMYGVASLVTNAIRWNTTNPAMLYGCDYIFNDNGTVGSNLVLQRDVRNISIRIANNVAGAAHQMAVLHSTTNTNSINNNSILQAYAMFASAIIGSTVYVSSGLKGDILKMLVSNTGISNSSECRFLGKLELD